MVSNANIAAVTAQYSSILFREGGTAPEIAYLAGLLDSGVVGQSQVAAALSLSAPALTVVDPVIRLYQTALGRAPDGAELASWVHLVDQGAATLDGVARALVGSTEFSALYGAHPDIGSAVTTLYHNALARGPDATGFADWTAYLHGTADLAGAIRVFADTTEAIGRMASGIINWQVAGALTGQPDALALSFSGPTPSAASLGLAQRCMSHVLFGAAPGGDGGATMAALAGLLDSGMLTQTQLSAALASSASATGIVDPIIRLYQAAFDRTADLAGLSAYSAQVSGGGATLLEVAGAMVSSQEFMSRFGNDPGHVALVNGLYEAALNRTPSTAELTSWTAALNSGGINAAQALLAFATSTEFTQASASAIVAWQTQYAVSNTYSATLAIGDHVAPVTPPDPSPNPPQPPQPPSGATTYILTTGIDTLVGSPQDDAFNGTLVFSNGAYSSASTLNPGDTLNGGGGTDTVSLAVSGAAVAPAYTVTPALTSIEHILVANSATDTANPVTINLSGDGSSVSLIGTSASTTAGVKTAFTNVGALAAIQMTGKGDLSVAYAGAVDAGAHDTASLTLNGVGTSASTLSALQVDSGIETLAITSAGAANYLKVIDPGVQNITVTGSQALVLDVSGATNTALTSVNASAVSGALTIEGMTSAGTFTAGSGASTFDFTTSGVVFSNAFHVTGSSGGTTLKIGQVNNTHALDNVTGVSSIIFSDSGSVSITAPVGLTSGQTFSVDASALTGSHGLTWDGSAAVLGVSVQITGGAGTNILTGGRGSDTINGGSGANVIDGKAGTNTINLGTHSGSDTILLNNLTNGFDTISGFVGTGAIHDQITVSTASGLYFVSSGGGNVTAGDAAVAMMVTATGALSFAGGVNMIILADQSYHDSAAVVTALGTGGQNAMTFSSTVGASAEILAIYSDGTNAHLVGINANPDQTVSAGTTSSAMTYTNLATLTGVSVVGLHSWSAADFHF